MIFKTDATSLIQGSAVFQPINNKIQHNSIMEMHHAFIHSPPIQGPVITREVPQVPLPDFTVLLRPSKLPNRYWMEPNFCPLPDLKFQGDICCQYRQNLLAFWRRSLSEKQHPKRCKLIPFWDGQPPETSQLRTLCGHRRVMGRQSCKVLYRRLVDRQRTANY